MTFLLLKVILVAAAGLMGSLHYYELESPRRAELSPERERSEGDSMDDETKF